MTIWQLCSKQSLNGTYTIRAHIKFQGRAQNLNNVRIHLVCINVITDHSNMENVCLALQSCYTKTFPITFLTCHLGFQNCNSRKQLQREDME